MTAPLPYNPTEVKALRDEMRRYGIKLTPTQCWEILRHVGDRNLVRDALLMTPNPKWVAEVIGKIRAEEDDS